MEISEKEDKMRIWLKKFDEPKFIKHANESLVKHKAILDKLWNYYEECSE